jgi:hypothetical protein
MADFMRLPELAESSGLAPRSIKNMFYAQKGALHPILTKFGGRLGCWRADWEKFKAAQLKLAGVGGNLDAANAQAASIQTTKGSDGNATAT